MNLINRAFVILLLLIVLVTSCASIFVILFGRSTLSAAVQPTLTAITDSNFNLTQLLCMGIAVLVFAFSILFLYLELMPTGKMRMRLKSIQGAEVMMSADAITSQLSYALDPLPGVIRASPRVSRGKGDTLDVSVELVTTADSDVKTKTEQVTEVTRNVLEGGLGLRVGKVTIKVDQMKAPSKPKAPIVGFGLQRLASPKTDQPEDS